MTDIQTHALIASALHFSIASIGFLDRGKFFHSKYLEISGDTSLLQEEPWGRQRGDSPIGPHCFETSKLMIPLLEQNELQIIQTQINEERKYMEGLLQQRVNFLIAIILGLFTITTTLFDKIPAAFILNFLLLGSALVKIMASYMTRAQAKLNLYTALLFRYSFPVMVYTKNLIDHKNKCVQDYFQTGKREALNTLNQAVFELFYATVSFVIYIFLGWHAAK